MKLIPLINGGDVMVDDEDYEAMCCWKWRRHMHGYAERSSSANRPRLMHRLLMGNPDGMQIDHRNGNRLDNRRANLRLASHSENLHNRGRSTNNTSGFKGVSWDVDREMWRATILVAGRWRQIGRFATKEDAARAYDAESVLMLGEFAVTNAAMGLL